MSRSNQFLSRRSSVAVLAIFVILSLARGAWVPLGAQDEPSTLVVGTKEAPPFAMKGADGEWTGISIELWRTLADTLGVDYELREYDLEGLLRAVENGQVDAGVAALTATAERERAMDFTHTFFRTGFGIAVGATERDVWSEIGDRLGSRFFASTVLALVVLLVVLGSLTWIVERRANPDLDLLTAVAATGRRGGGRAPKTAAGRFLGLAWALGAVVLLGSFFAIMAADLVAGRMEGPIQGLEDLADARVGTVAGSTSQGFLDDRGISSVSFDRLESALDGAEKGEVDAVVYDAPLLQYLAARRPGIEVLPETFEQQSYSIALPTASPLREQLNRALLSDPVQRRWREIVGEYLDERPAPPVKPTVPAES